MFLKYWGVVLLASLASAEIPSYFKVCGRKNPNLEKCVLEAVDYLRPQLRKGIPELNVPSLEPLHLEGFPLSETEALKAYASNVYFVGFSDFDAKSFRIDFDKKILDISVVFKKINLEADYDVVAKILVPIAGKGPISIVADDVRADVKLHYKLIKKKGAEYMFFTSMTMKLNIKDYTAHFKPAEGPDSHLAVAINAALDGGRQEILETMKPTMERVVSTEVIKLGNKITSHFTFDELFPDRE